MISRESSPKQFRDFHPFRASTQSNNYYLIFGRTTCYLFRLDEIVTSPNNQVKPKSFPHPCRKLAMLTKYPSKKMMTACVLGRRLLLIWFDKRWRMHSCDLEQVVQSPELEQVVEWREEHAFSDYVGRTRKVEKMMFENCVVDQSFFEAEDERSSDSDTSSSTSCPSSNSSSRSSSPW